MIGIYKITTLHNQKMYIGYSNNIKERFRIHKCNLKNNKHDNNILQNVYNKYGIDNFKFEIIEECILDKCIEREHFYVIKYKTNERKFGYNIALTGLNYVKMSQESIEKSKKTRKENAMKRGYYFSEETIKKQALARKGFRHTLETKIKIGIASKNRKKAKSTIELQKQKIIKKVDQYDLENNFIKTWDSISEALISLKKPLNSGHISSCCKNKRNKAYGYKWKYHIKN